MTWELRVCAALLAAIFVLCLGLTLAHTQNGFPYPHADPDVVAPQFSKSCPVGETGLNAGWCACPSDFEFSAKRHACVRKAR